MKDLLLIGSLFLAFIACKGEEFSQKKAQDPYQRIEHLAQEKAQYQPRPAKNYQKVVVPAKLKYYYQSVDFTKNGDELKEDLAVLTIAKHSHFISHGYCHPYL